MLKAAKAYMATQVTTASQGDLLVMLYDTAIKHLHQAIDKMRVGDMAGKGILISKAITIVSELQESLNKERGGEISKNLFQLYFFCNARLLKANLKVQPEMVEEVITILSGLRQAFAQILPSQDGVASLTQPGAGTPPAAAPSAAPVAPPAAQAAVAPSYAPAAGAHMAEGYPQPGAQSMPQPVPGVLPQQAPKAPLPSAPAQEMPVHEASAQDLPVAPPLLPTAAAVPPAQAAPAQAAPVPAANTLRFRAANAYATSR